MREFSRPGWQVVLYGLNKLYLVTYILIYKIIFSYAHTHSCLHAVTISELRGLDLKENTESYMGEF